MEPATCISPPASWALPPIVASGSMVMVPPATSMLRPTRPVKVTAPPAARTLRSTRPPTVTEPAPTMRSPRTVWPTVTRPPPAIRSPLTSAPTSTPPPKAYRSEAIRPRLTMVPATSAPSAEADETTSATRARRSAVRPACRNEPARVWPGPIAPRLGQTRDIGQVAIALLGVQAIADHEDVGDLAPHVVEGDVGRARPALGHEGAGFDGGGPARLEVAQEVGEAQPARADPLHHEHVAAFQRLVEILADADNARGGDLAVGNDGDEIHGGGNGQRAQQIGEEDRGALQHPDQVHRLVRVVGGDLGSQARHLGADGLLVEQRLAEPRVEDGHQAKRVALTKARASSMAAGSTRPAVSHSSRHWEMVRMAWSS